MDTLEWAAMMDKDKVELTESQRRSIIQDHGHVDVEADVDETNDFGWLGLFEWLEY